MSSRFIMPFADVGSGIKPSSGAKLFFFEIDGVTPKDTFSDQLSTPTPNTNPVISDGNGVFGDIYIRGDYKVTLKNKNDSLKFSLAEVSEVATNVDANVTVIKVFETVQQFKDYDFEFPDGKIIHLLDRDADFTKISGTGTANTFDIIASSSINQSIDIIAKNNTVTFEQMGGVADYNPSTLTGTSLSPVIAAIKARGFNVDLTPNSKYKITQDIEIFTGMVWSGDFTTEIHLDFSSSGKRMLISPDALHKNVTIKGLTLVRIGNNAEHGALLDALEDCNFDVAVLSDGNAAGGAFGVSPFYPENRPSKNVECKVRCTNAGNFGLQYGNVIGGSVELINEGTQREALGLEPYTLGKQDVTSITSDTINYPSHGMISGDPIIYSREGNTVIPGITSGRFYFAIIIDSDNIKLAASAEQAWIGSEIALGSVTGSQRFYKAGMLENIEVKGVRSIVGDVPSAGSATGIVIVTATSGGYHRNVRVSNCRSSLNNPTSGAQNITVFGANGAVISDNDILGAETVGILVTRGFVQGVRDSSGDIDPLVGLEILPDVIVENNTVQGAKEQCIKVAYGRCVTRNNSCKTNIAGAVGIQVDVVAEDEGSYTENNTSEAVNGTAFIFKQGRNNRDPLNPGLFNRQIVRSGETFQQYEVNLTTSSGEVCLLGGIGGSTQNFSGTMHITAKPSNSGTTETSSYFLNICKRATGLDGQVDLISALGLITGAGANHPSFTWTIDSSNNLIATIVGSTDPNKDWFFWLSTVGDLNALK